MPKTRSITDYKKAFQKFSSAPDSDFKTESRDRHLCVLWQGETYMISSFEDFKEDYRDFFEKESYDEIYTEIPTQVWDVMLNECLGMSLPDFMVNFYKAWRVYWQDKKEHINRDEHYEKLKNSSWFDLQVFFEAIKQDYTKVINFASSINDIEFLPMIAMAIMREYESLDIFLDECVQSLIDNSEFATMTGDPFHDVVIETKGKNEVFYVYKTLFELDAEESVTNA